MADFDISLVGVQKLLGSSTGRDKVGKLVHYSARGFAGIFADLKEGYAKGTPEHEFVAWCHDKARALFVRIMQARRTTRWFAEIGIFLSLFKPAPWKDAPQMFYVAQTGMLWWHILDHYRWLQQIKWLEGDQAVTKRVSFAGFVIAAFISFFYFLNKLIKTPAEETSEKKAATRRQVVKHFVTVLATLHISELLTTHEAICGFGGAIAAAIDIYNLFPKKPAKEE